MDCRTYKTKLIDLLQNGEIHPFPVAMGSHQQHCAACSRFHQQITTQYGVLQKEKSEAFNPYLAEKILHKLPGKTGVALHRRSLASPALLYISVICIGLFAGFGLSLSLGNDTQAEGRLGVTGSPDAADTAENDVLTLQE